MAETKRTIVVKQIGSPIRRPDVQRRTLIGLGLNKMHKTRELEDTPCRARHGQLDPASGDDRRGARLSASTLPAAKPVPPRFSPRCPMDTSMRGGMMRLRSLSLVPNSGSDCRSATAVSRITREQCAPFSA